MVGKKFSGEGDPTFYNQVTVQDSTNDEDASVRVKIVKQTPVRQRTKNEAELDDSFSIPQHSEEKQAEPSAVHSSHFKANHSQPSM